MIINFLKQFWHHVLIAGTFGAGALIKRTGDALKFARAQSCDFATGYPTAYGEIAVAALEYWYWFVLAVRPDYLHTAPRLIDLADRAPQTVWAAAFLTAAIYKTVMLVFGTHSEITIKDKTYMNPFMRSTRQVKAWYIARIAGLMFLGVSLHSMVARFLSEQGISWGTGMFVFQCVLCTFAMVKIGTFLVVEFSRPRAPRTGLRITRREVA